MPYSEPTYDTGSPRYEITLKHPTLESYVVISMFVQDYTAVPTADTVHQNVLDTLVAAGWRDPQAVKLITGLIVLTPTETEPPE